MSSDNEKIFELIDDGDFEDGDGEFERLQDILSRGNFDVTWTNKYGYTPLYIASRKGLSKVVKLLLDNNYDVNIAGNDGETSLQAATRNGRTEVINLLKNAGATSGGRRKKRKTNKKRKTTKRRKSSKRRKSYRK